MKRLKIVSLLTGMTSALLLVQTAAAAEFFVSPDGAHQPAGAGRAEQSQTRPADAGLASVLRAIVVVVGVDGPAQHRAVAQVAAGDDVAKLQADVAQRPCARIAARHEGLTHEDGVGTGSSVVDDVLRPTHT